MINLKYNDYLTEQKMINLFQQLKGITNNFDFDTNIKIGKRFRGDLSIDTKKRKHLIEFDGYLHYTDPNTICRDEEKDLIWINDCLTKVIRIPYFIQLNSNNFKFIFKDVLEDLNIQDINIDMNYKDGFWDKKVIFPASFCSLGIERFENFLDENLSSNNVFYIFQSLIDKILKQNIPEKRVLYKGFKEKYNLKLT